MNMLKALWRQSRRILKPLPEALAYPKCSQCGWRIAHTNTPEGYEAQNCMARECPYSKRPVLMETLKRKDHA